LLIIIDRLIELDEQSRPGPGSPTRAAWTDAPVGPAAAPTTKGNR
jgi:hypothetical protein